MSHDEGGSALLDRFAERRVLAKIVVGFLVAGIFIYFLGLAIGWRRVFAVLVTADPLWIGVACLSTLLGLITWGKAWQVVLSVIGIEVSFRRISVTYLAATFANYVTPFGQAGGEPFIAYVLSRETNASYEDSLASVVTVDLLNLLPFFNFAAIGFVVLLWQATLPRTVRWLTFGLAALAIAIPVLAYAGWNYRAGVERAVLGLIGPIAERTDRISVDGVRRRVERFYGSLERIAAEPRQVAYTLVFSYTGWILFTLPLYFAALSLNLPLDPLLILFIVPASTVAALVPTPGGLGASEASLTVLIWFLQSGITEPEALALAGVYRVTSYVFAVLIGGIAALYVIARA